MKIALGFLVVAFIIVLFLMIYYWWQFSTARGTFSLASSTATINPAFSQKVLNMRLNCFGNMPPINKMKPPVGYIPPPRPPL